MDKNENFLGAKLALFLGDHLLVLLRDDTPLIPYPNHWDFPGGGREGNETPFETAQRETIEEVGLFVPESACVWKKSHPAETNPNLQNWFFVGHLPEQAFDQAHLGDEGQLLKLMRPDQYINHPKRIPHFANYLKEYLNAA